jgi:hypothetical protein
METMLKNLIKEAVLEALVDYFGSDESASTFNVGAGANSGGTPSKDKKPKPDVGVGTW